MSIKVEDLEAHRPDVELEPTARVPASETTLAPGARGACDGDRTVLEARVERWLESGRRYAACSDTEYDTADDVVGYGETGAQA